MSRTRMDDRVFGEWLDDQLRRSGASRKELALGIGASPGTINSWVGGHRRISGENADKVADFFGAPRDVVREMANRPAVSGSVPGLIGLRGRVDVSGVACVAFIPIIGSTPYDVRRTTAQLGNVMPFAAEYAARFRDPSIITVNDDSLVHRGIHAGASLLIEQDIGPEQIGTGALVVLSEYEDRYSVASWYVDEAGAVTVVPEGAGRGPIRYYPDENTPELVGLARSVFNFSSIE